MKIGTVLAVGTGVTIGYLLCKMLQEKRSETENIEVSEYESEGEALMPEVVGNPEDEDWVDEYEEELWDEYNEIRGIDNTVDECNDNLDDIEESDDVVLCKAVSEGVKTPDKIEIVEDTGIESELPDYDTEDCDLSEFETLDEALDSDCKWVEDAETDSDF